MPDDVTRFWAEYAGAEVEWLRRRSEMDETEWIEKASEALYDFSNLGTAPFDSAKPETFEPRKLYKYRVYEHPKRGVIYRLFTDWEQSTDHGPDRQYIARSSGETMRLAAEFETCAFCGGSGKDDGKRCRECGGKSVFPKSSSAKRWATLGTFKEEVLVEEPTNGLQIYEGPTLDW